MNTIELLKSGFEHSVFVNKNPKTIEGIVMRVVNDPNVTLFPKKLNNMKIEAISDTRDKVTMSFDDEEVTSFWTWRNSADGKCFVLGKIE